MKSLQLGRGTILLIKGEDGTEFTLTCNEINLSTVEERFDHYSLNQYGERVRDKSVVVSFEGRIDGNGILAVIENLGQKDAPELPSVRKIRV